MFELIFNFVEHFVTSLVKDVQSVELYFDQFTEQENGQSDNLPNPRVLVEIGEPEVIQSTLNTNIQVLQVPVVLHIGIDMFDGVRTNSELKLANLKALRINDLLYEALQSQYSTQLPDDKQVSGLIIREFDRTSFNIAKNPGNIKVSTITFNALIEDTRVNRYDTFTASTPEALTISVE